MNRRVATDRVTISSSDRTFEIGRLRSIPATAARSAGTMSSGARRVCITRSTVVDVLPPLGKYTASVGSASRLCSRMLPTTPMTSAGVSPCPFQSRIVRPIGFWPGHSRSATRALTIVRHGLPITSSSVKPRPATSGTAIVSK